MKSAAKIIEIADALVWELNAATFSRKFTAERCYQPTFDLPDLQTLKVTVVPKGISPMAGEGSRGAMQHDYQVHVAVQKKLATTGDEQKAELDALMLFVEEIAKHLERNRLGACEDAKWVTQELDPVFLPEHLEELRQFTSVLTLTYRAAR